MNETGWRVAQYVRTRLAELDDQLSAVESDPELTDEGRVRRKRQIAHIRGTVTGYAMAALPLLAELDAVGVRVYELGELQDLKVVDSRVPSILAEYLPRADFPPLKRDIAHALSAAWARPIGVRALLAELSRIEPASDPGTDSVRSALAEALDRSLVQKDVDAGFAEALLAFCRDEDQGSARWFAILAMGKLKFAKREATPVLLRLAQSDEFDVPAAVSLGRLGVIEAKDLVEDRLRAHAQDSNPWARKQLAKVLRQLSK